ncbi:MAG: amidohydrolase family protein [Planctomycetota bacterium]
MIRFQMSSLAVLFVLSLGLGANGQIAIKGDKVYPIAAAVIENGVVLVGKDGKIEAVGSASSIKIPDGYRVLQGKVVTPGLIDGRSVVGLAGQYNRNQDQEQHEKSAPIQAELRALDAYNYRETLVTWLREHGVTTVNTGHAPAALISGQSMIVKTTEAPIEKTVLKKTAMVLATLGDGGRARGGKAPGTRAKQVALLRAELVKAKEYAAKLVSAKDDKKPSRDLGLETLALVLAGKVPLLVTANRDRDILTALRVGREFSIKIILDGAAEIHQVLEEVKKAGVSVILHAPMVRATGERENASWATAAKLAKAGIPFTLQSGYESYVPKTRVVLFEAAIAAANGLGFEKALRVITLDAAKILGIEKRVGSLEVGKDGDVVVFDGDPFEYTSHVTGVVIDGVVVSSVKR